VLSWIESQDTAVIAALVFTLSYLLAALIFMAGILMSRRRIADELKATTPAMLTPLSVIVGLLIAFLAARVWSNVDHARADLTQEANALRTTMLFSGNLTGTVPTSVRASISRYIRFVETDDWPAMARGEADLRQVPPDLADALSALLSYVPATPGHQIAQQRAVIAMEQAMQLRRDRILLSKAAIAPIQWYVIILLFALILLTIAMVHGDRAGTVAVNLFVYATAVAACLVLLMVNDRPFAPGGFTVQPEALQAIRPD
jgi:cytochrome bd-type quinol oxidase subunit 2